MRLILSGVIERAFDVFEEFGGSDLADEYFLSVERFLEKYSLRYDLRRPCSLHPTLLDYSPS